jgi:hypothetical protein
MVFEPAKLPRGGHVAVHHVVFFTSSPRTVLAFLTPPRRRNYVHGQKTKEGTLTLAGGNSAQPFRDRRRGGKWRISSRRE